jgi:hypothetical protein
VPPLGGFLEDIGHGVPQLAERTIAAEANLFAGGVSEGEVKPLGPDAGEGIEHRQRWPGSAAPRVSRFTDRSFCFSLIRSDGPATELLKSLRLSASGDFGPISGKLFQPPTNGIPCFWRYSWMINRNCSCSASRLSPRAVGSCSLD